MQKIFRQYYRSSDVFFLCNELLSQVKKDGRPTTGPGRLLFELGIWRQKEKFTENANNINNLLAVHLFYIMTFEPRENHTTCLTSSRFVATYVVLD